MDAIDVYNMKNAVCGDSPTDLWLISSLDGQTAGIVQ